MTFRGLFSFILVALPVYILSTCQHVWAINCGKTSIYSETFLKSDPLINSSKPEIVIKPIEGIEQIKRGEIFVIKGRFVLGEPIFWQTLLEYFNYYKKDDVIYYEVKVDSFDGEQVIVSSLLNITNKLTVSIPANLVNIIFYTAKSTFEPPELDSYLQLGSDSMMLGVRRDYRVVKSKNSNYPNGSHYKVGKHHGVTGLNGSRTTNDFPFPVKYKGPLENDFSTVEIGVWGQPIQVEVPNRDLYPSRIGSPSRLKLILDPIFKEPITFNIGDVVGYRAPNGHVKQGSIVSIQGEYARVQADWPYQRPLNVLSIRNSTDLFQWALPRKIHLNHLYKQLGSSKLVSTKQRIFALRGAGPFSFPEFRYFLNSVLRYASTDTFRAFDLDQQIHLIGKLIHKHLPWRNGGRNIGIGGKNLNWDEQICFAVGVCRHHNPIMGIILGELGFPVRLKTMVQRFTDSRHILVEVLIDGKIWAIDLASFEQQEISIEKFSNAQKSQSNPNVDYDYFYFQSEKSNNWNLK